MSREKLRGNMRICSAGRLDSYQEEWGERHIHPRRIELAIKAGCEPVFCEQVPSIFKNSAVSLSRFSHICPEPVFANHHHFS